MYRCVVAMDIDGTLTPIRSSWAFLHHVLGSRARSRRYGDLFRCGLISYEEWVYLDLSLWKGLSYECFRKILHSIPWRSGVEYVRKLVERWRDRVLFVAVTGGFAELGERVVEELGFHEFVGTVVEVRNGKLTGFAKSYVEFCHGKVEGLLEILERRGLDSVPIVSIGDSYIDRELFEISDISIAFCPEDPELSRTVNLVTNCSLRTLASVLDKVLKHVLGEHELGKDLPKRLASSPLNRDGDSKTRASAR